MKSVDDAAQVAPHGWCVVKEVVPGAGELRLQGRLEMVSQPLPTRHAR